eukprot:1837562-Heterocapsa_arctica.AAC.1
MSEDLDGGRRFPANIPYIIFDNLNVLYDSNNKFVGMSPHNWANVRDMFVLMDMFRCHFYVCSAPASRWGLRSGFDVA